MTERIEYAGVTYMCSGAVSGNWWRGDHNHTDEGYAVIDLYDDGSLRISTSRIDGRCSRLNAATLLSLCSSAVSVDWAGTYVRLSAIIIGITITVAENDSNYGGNDIINVNSSIDDDGGGGRLLWRQRRWMWRRRQRRRRHRRR